MRIKPLFAWFDFWVGVFWNSRQRRLYILPLPCIGLVIDFAPVPPRLPLNMLGTPKTGIPFIRDVSHPCDCYNPRPREPGDHPECQTDGHYLCRECVHRDPTLDEREVPA